MQWHPRDEALPGILDPARADYRRIACGKLSINGGVKAETVREIGSPIEGQQTEITTCAVPQGRELHGRRPRER